jgi:hypothetical protein
MRIIIPKEPPREIAPVGSHDAVCFACVDLGTQNGPYGAKHQLYIAWELPEEFTSKGKPFQVGKFYSLSRNARGHLRQDLESWLGRVLEDSEFEGLDLLTLVGRAGTIGLKHEANQAEEIRAMITSISPARKGIPTRLQTLSAPVLFGFEENGGFDRDAYNDLPEWLRNIVAKSPEHRNAGISGIAQGSTDEQLRAQLAAQPSPANPPAKRGPVLTRPGTAPVAAAAADAPLDDDIPF